MTEVIIEVGPAVVRGPGNVDVESCTVALDCIDDELAIVDDSPVTVARLWRDVLAAAAGPDAQALVLVCPSWWPPAHLDLVGDAGRGVAADVDLLCRAQALAAGLPHRFWAVVEIGPDVVVVTRKEAAAVGIPRIRERREVAVAVAAAVGRGTYAVVDAPDGVRDAVPLGEVIVELVRCGGGVATLVDGDRVLCGAQTLRSRLSPQSAPDAVVTVRAGRRPGRAVLAGVLGVLAVVSTGLAVGPHRDAAQPLPVVPMTLLVEGRIGVTVPAQWRVERVTEGPGSARVQVISPADTHVGLHLTQSPLPSRQSLATVAQTLREAFDVQPSGVFVDFNPADQLAGKPVVTYREVRADHHIRWAVLIDDMVRIGVGCQSAPAHDDLVRDACDTAIRSAHAVF